MTDKYAVIGNPVAHSKSPLIHAAFARQTHQDISYEAILSPLDGFEKTVNDLIMQGYKGANVTVPFKLEAFRLYSQVNYFKPNVVDAGAVNTLTFSDGGTVKDNTDGIGLVRDIQQNLNCQIGNKRVLLIGAGGAAEGVLHPILDTRPRLLVISNRSSEKALTMQKKINNSEHPVTTVSTFAFEDLHNQQFDLVINATSTGLTDTALPIPSTIFAKNSLAYDMMYGRETPFMRQAREAGAQVADGLGMLVEQAAEAFYLWRHVRPETSAVINLLRKTLD